MRKLLLLLPVLTFLSTSVRGEEVFLVNVSGTIEKGLAAFIERVMSEAETDAAEAVIIEIDTPRMLPRR